MKKSIKKLLKTNKTKILKIIYKTKTNLKNWLKNCPMRLLPPTEKNKTRKLLLKSPSQTATSWTGRRRFFFLKNKIKRTVTGFDFISCCLGIKGLWTFFLIFIFFSLTYTERYTSKFHSRSESERRVYSIRSLISEVQKKTLIHNEDCYDSDWCCLDGLCDSGSW